jgi:hypothetical protein
MAYHIRQTNLLHPAIVIYYRARCKNLAEARDALRRYHADDATAQGWVKSPITGDGYDLVNTHSVVPFRVAIHRG